MFQFSVSLCAFGVFFPVLVRLEEPEILSTKITFLLCTCNSPCVFLDMTVKICAGGG